MIGRMLKFLGLTFLGLCLLAGYGCSRIFTAANRSTYAASDAASSAASVASAAAEAAAGAAEASSSSGNPFDYGYQASSYSGEPSYCRNLREAFQRQWDHAIDSKSMKYREAELWQEKAELEERCRRR